MHAVEVSRFACSNFLARMIDEEVDDIVLTLGDALTAPLQGGYDLVVAYGLLHCLSSRSAVRELLAQMQHITNPGGLNVVSSFTDEREIPDEQSYLSPTLLRRDEILSHYQVPWRIERYENDIITESHPTSRTPHQHSLYRLIARNSG